MLAPVVQPGGGDVGVVRERVGGGGGAVVRGGSVGDRPLLQGKLYTFHD